MAGDDEERPDGEPPAEEPTELEEAAGSLAPGAQKILRHARGLAIAFFGSWGAAFVGSRLDFDPLYYAGLGGVGLTMVLFLIWLTP